jgi:hypothetical protein
MMRRLSLQGLSLLGLAAPTAFAQSIELTHQGRLASPTGNPLDGPVAVTIRLYDVPTGGTALWTRTLTVTATDGFYATRLGADDVGVPVDQVLFAHPGDVWLGLTVGTSELAPRDHLAHVPAAVLARSVDSGAANGTRLDRQGRLLLGTTTGETCTIAGELAFDAETGQLRVCDGEAYTAVGAPASTTDYGDGRDGDVTIGGTANLHTQVLGSGRAGQPDAVATAVTANPAGTDVSVSSTTGFAPGDLALLINLRGAPGNVADVGNWEILEVAQVLSSTNLRFRDAPTKSYAGSSFAAQRVIVQRVPQWNDVTVSSGGTLTGNAWEGSFGGVLAFVANGIVRIDGTVHMSERGYRGGTGTIINGTTGAKWTPDGEGRTGLGSASDATPNDSGGSGSYGTPGLYNSNAGGGAYATRDAGTFGNQANGSISGTSGNVIGTADLAQLHLGGGGGGCMAEVAPTVLDGGDAGGIVVIRGKRLVINGVVASNGQGNSSCTGTDPSNMAGGSGGAIYLVSDDLTAAATTIQARGGAASSNANNGQGAAGGVGRIRLDYGTLNSVAYPATSAEQTAADPDPGYSFGL